MLWRGESFSSCAAAKHLPASPQPGEPGDKTPVYPSLGTLTQPQPGAGAVVPVSARASGVSAGFCCCASASPGPCVSLFPRNCRGKMPRSALLERLVFRGKSGDLVRPKHNKGWDLQLPDPSATFLQPFCLCYKRVTKRRSLWSLSQPQVVWDKGSMSNLAWGAGGNVPEVSPGMVTSHCPSRCPFCPSSWCLHGAGQGLGEPWLCSALLRGSWGTQGMEVAQGDRGSHGPQAGGIPPHTSEPCSTPQNPVPRWEGTGGSCHAWQWDKAQLSPGRAATSWAGAKRLSWPCTVRGL